MRYWIGLWIVLHTVPASADAAKAQEYVNHGNRWIDVLQYEKAIEEFERAYQEDGRAMRLNSIAESYDQMATMADSAAEALSNKRRALRLYTTFLSKAPDTDPEVEPFRKTAAARIEPLRQELKELEVRSMEQEGAIREIRDGIRQLLIEVRALRELILRPHRGGVHTSFPQ